MTTFTQHEVEIIQGHIKILNTDDFSAVCTDIEKMLSVLQTEAGRNFIQDPKQLAYTYKNYLSVSKKLAGLTEKEFKQLDLTTATELY